MTREQALKIWERYQRGVFVNPTDIQAAIEVSVEAIKQSQAHSRSVVRVRGWFDDPKGTFPG